jgi:hypothetical protein
VNPLALAMGSVKSGMDTDSQKQALSRACRYELRRAIGPLPPHQPRTIFRQIVFRRAAREGEKAARPTSHATGASSAVALSRPRSFCPAALRTTGPDEHEDKIEACQEPKPCERRGLAITDPRGMPPAFRDGEG